MDIYNSDISWNLDEVRYVITCNMMYKFCFELMWTMNKECTIHNSKWRNANAQAS